MAQLIPLERLDALLRAQLEGPRITVVLRRNPQQPQDLPLLELDGLEAQTVKLLFDETSVAQPPTTTPWGLQGANPQKWWEGLSKLLLACDLLSPADIDGAVLRDLAKDKHRRLRFCCDTSALANGLAHWVIARFPGRVDLITSTLVEREIMAWADRNGREMFEMKRAEHWHQMVQFTLARRLVERPPPGVSIDRLAPDQAALMLAKVRDDARRAGDVTEGKSPDADILMLHLTRDLMRTQPANTRVIFLCADRGLARTAINVLGADSVLYAHPERAAQTPAQQESPRIVPRGVWLRAGTLGALARRPIGELLWTLLAACHELVLCDHAQGKAWRLAHARLGTRPLPSEWSNPTLHWEEIVWPQAVAQAPAAPAPQSPAAPEPQEPPQQPAAPEAPLPEALLSTPPAEASHDRAEATPRILLTEAEAPPLRSTKRPNVGVSNFLSALEDLCLERADTTPPTVEVARLLRALEVADADDPWQPGARIERFRQIWRTNDLDGLHGELLSIQTYRDVTIWVREHHGAAQLPDTLKERDKSCLRLAQALGQLLHIDGGWWYGGAGLTEEALLGWLNARVPRGDVITVKTLFLDALRELKISPPRLVRALQLHWQFHPESDYHPGASGTVDASLNVPQVVQLNTEGFTLDAFPLAYMDLGGLPIRTLERRP